MISDVLPTSQIAEACFPYLTNLLFLCLPACAFAVVQGDTV